MSGVTDSGKRRRPGLRAKLIILAIGLVAVGAVLAGSFFVLPKPAALGAPADIALPKDVTDSYGEVTAEEVLQLPENQVWTEMNAALAAGDRTGFLARGAGAGLEALTRWWDNTKAIGWTVAAITPEDQGDAMTSRVVLGAQLAFAPATDRGSGDFDAGLAQIQGNLYDAQFDGAGADRRIVSLTPVYQPAPWDEGTVHVQKRDHVVLYAQSDEAALVDANIDLAERSAVEALDILKDMGGWAPMHGFVAAITNDPDRMTRWQYGTGTPWDMDVAGFASPMMRPAQAAPWMDQTIAIGDGLSSGTSIVVGPLSADQRESTFVHEFAHALHGAAYPSYLAAPPAAVMEGWARAVEWHGGLSEPAYARSEVKDLIAQAGADAFSQEVIRGDEAWRGYEAAGSYYAFVIANGGGGWTVALQARADSLGLVGFAAKNPQFSIEKWQAWVAAQ